MLVAIKLTKDEYEYLCKARFLPNEIKKILFSIKKKDDHFFMNLTEDLADAIRDLCGERLQLAGFDDKYTPTKEGVLLEELIDKFFIA